MYALVEHSTDMRYPNYKIIFTSSKKRVKEALNTEGHYTYNDPESAKNWHNTFVDVYEMPEGWRKPTQSFINSEVARKRGSIYSPNAAGVMAEAIFRDGYRIESEEEL